MEIEYELVVVVRSLQIVAVAVGFEVVVAVTSGEMFYLPALIGLD